MRNLQVPDTRPALRGTDRLGPGRRCLARQDSHLHRLSSVRLYGQDGNFGLTNGRCRCITSARRTVQRPDGQAGRRDLDRVDSDRSVCGVRADFDVDVDGCDNDAAGTGPRTHSPLPPDNFLTCGRRCDLDYRDRPEWSLAGERPPGRRRKFDLRKINRLASSERAGERASELPAAAGEEM